VSAVAVAVINPYRKDKNLSMGIKSQAHNRSIKWCMQNPRKHWKTSYNATKGGWIQSSNSPFEK
jgi:hypothetical protein